MKTRANSQILIVLSLLCCNALVSCAPTGGGGGGGNGAPDDGMMDDGGDNGNNSDGDPDPGEMTGPVSGEFNATEGLILGTEGIALHMAAHAAPSNSSITLRPLSESDLVESGLPEDGGFDQGMELLPSGTTFAAPVEISVMLAHAPAIETLNVLRLDEALGMWSGTDIVATVSDDGTVATFELQSFSSYAPWNPPLPPGDVAIEDGEIIAGTGLYSGQPFSVFPGYVNTMASLTYSPFGNVFALSLLNVDLENPMTGDLITLAGGLHSTEVRRLDQGVIVGLVTALGGLSGPSIYEDGTSPVPKPVTGIMYLRKDATQWKVDVYAAYEGGIFFGQAVGDL